MRIKIIVISVLTAALFCAAGAFGPAARAETAGTNAGITPEMRANVASLQVPFIQNEGQIGDATVRFYANTFAGSVFVTPDGLTYALGSGDGQGWALREEFTGAGPAVPVGYKPSPTRVNSFVGSDSGAWKSGLPTYEEVALGEVYDRINVSLRAYGNNVEKIFTVSPGGDPAKIKIKVPGAEGISVNATGELELATGMGAVSMSRPTAYQEIDGRRVDVDAAYTLQEDGYGFALGAYDPTYSLVIDPLLASTFLGVNAAIDNISRMTLFDGKVYVTGQTRSNNFPKTTGVTMSPSSDVYVTVLNGDLTGNPATNLPLASTLFGGTGSDTPVAIRVNSSGVYVVGSAGSTNFPVYPNPGAYQISKPGGNDSFITKLSPDLSSLLGSTYFGGTGAGIDEIRDLALDAAGNVYVAGTTQASNFKVANIALDRVFSGASEGFITKLKDDLTGDQEGYPLASTFLGGSNGGSVSALAIDPGTDPAGAADDQIYVTGVASDGFQQTLATNGVFVARLNSSLSGMDASTFVGNVTGSTSGVKAITLDADSLVIAGDLSSLSTYQVTVGAYVYQDTASGSTDIFATRLNKNLTALSASSRFGGSSNDTFYDLKLDAAGNVYLAGKTTSNNFPTKPWAYQPAYAGGSGTDFFIAKLSADLSSLDASTCLGTTANDTIGGLAVSPGGIYVAGYTASAAFPHKDSGYQKDFSGGTQTDGVIVKLSADLSRDTPYWPGSPSLTATNVTNAGLTLTWSPASYCTGVASYRIYRDGSVIDTVYGGLTSYNVTGLSAETAYNFKVEAGSATDLWSSDGPGVPQTTPAGESEPPTWPGTRELSAGDVTETGLTLTWTAAVDNTAVNAYRIYQGETLLGSVGGSTLTYSVSNLIAGTQYTFRVEAGDAFDNWSTVNNPSVTVATREPDTIAPYWQPGSSLRIGQ